MKTVLQLDGDGNIIGDFTDRCEIILTAAGMIGVWGNLTIRGKKVARSWVLLGSTAKHGDNTVTVEGDVTGWDIGSEILISPTGHDPHLGETRIIQDIVKGESGMTVIKLNSALEYEHYAGKEEQYEQRTVRVQGEVALLGRNVVVRGEGLGDDNKYQRWNNPNGKDVTGSKGTCGDSICNRLESSKTCPSDCKGPFHGACSYHYWISTS